MTASYATTRHSLHGLAELVLAGPRYAGGGSMQLRADSDGIRTWDDPPVRLSGGELVSDAHRVRLDGITFADAAAAIGLTAHPLDDVYRDGPHVRPDEVIAVDPADLDVVEDALSRGDVALRRFASSVEPILWPEHFDIGITVGDVNYGVSPGDGYHEFPYAYVGPHDLRQGAFWNAPFGAVRPVTDLSDVAALVEFFREGALEAAR
jgi:hypothetical protein